MQTAAYLRCPRRMWRPAAEARESKAALNDPQEWNVPAAGAAVIAKSLFPPILPVLQRPLTVVSCASCNCCAAEMTWQRRAQSIYHYTAQLPPPRPIAALPAVPALLLV